MGGSERFPWVRSPWYETCWPREGQQSTLSLLLIYITPSRLSSRLPTGGTVAGEGVSELFSRVPRFGSGPQL